MTLAAARTRLASEASTDQLVQEWIRLWNGDLVVAQSVVSHDLKLHASRGNGATCDAGPNALTSWISVMRNVIPDLYFGIEVGPSPTATSSLFAGSPAATTQPAPRRYEPRRNRNPRQRYRHPAYLPRTRRRVLVNADMHVLLGQLDILPS